jgi:hypothetical protein
VYFGRAQSLLRVEQKGKPGETRRGGASAFHDPALLCDALSTLLLIARFSLHRSPAAFLVGPDEAAIALQSVDKRERFLRALFFLDALTDQPDEVDAGAES